MIDTKLLQDLTGQTISLLRKYKEALDAHEKSQPLFISADGKEIFDGNEFWYVSTSCECYSLIADASTKFHERCFRAKEAAQEYVWKNKPVFSYTDIKNAMLNMDTLSHYEELAKQRITLK